MVSGVPERKHWRKSTKRWSWLLHKERWILPEIHVTFHRIFWGCFLQKCQIYFNNPLHYINRQSVSKFYRHTRLFHYIIDNYSFCLASTSVFPKETLEDKGMCENVRWLYKKRRVLSWLIHSLFFSHVPSLVHLQSRVCTKGKMKTKRLKRKLN